MGQDSCALFVPAFTNSSLDFLYTFSMNLYHKWVVKNIISFALQFFFLISDNLGGVYCLVVTSHPRPIQMKNEWTYRPQLHSFPSDVLSHRHHLVNNGVHLLQIPKKITLISSKDYSKARCCPIHLYLIFEKSSWKNQVG